MNRAQQRSAKGWVAHAGSGSLVAIAGGFGAAAMVVVSSVVLLLVIWLSGIGLRDQRYFDGWILAAGMGIQLGFHIATKTGRLSPRSVARWRTVHIYIGCFLIMAFLSHVGFSLPDMALEWALAAGFAVVTVSGVAGTYLGWLLRSRRSIDSGLSLDRIEARRTEIARAVEAAVQQSAPVVSAILPAPPYDSWIADLYANQLRDFFTARNDGVTHLIGSRRALDRLTAEIEELSRYLDDPGRAKLAAIRSLAVEKNQLDVARIHLGLGEAWLLIHVPVTYALIVLSVLHIVVVYAFTARPW